jgi:hypothetical protein
MYITVRIVTSTTNALNRIKLLNLKAERTWVGLTKARLVSRQIRILALPPLSDRGVVSKLSSEFSCGPFTVIKTQIILLAPRFSKKLSNRSFRCLRIFQLYLFRVGSEKCPGRSLPRCAFLSNNKSLSGQEIMLNFLQMSDAEMILPE